VRSASHDGGHQPPSRCGPTGHCYPAGGPQKRAAGIVGVTKARSAAAGGAVTGFLADPAAGRVFAVSRTVRSTDATPDGRLRLDGLARYLQEAAEDDVVDAGWDEPYDWLLRKSAVILHGYPRLGEPVRVRTFCSAIGPRWAERTTTLAAQGRDLIQARAVWVAIGRYTGAPAPLGDRFRSIYGPSAAGRTVSVRLSHPGPGPDAASRPWPLRSADFDAAGHVNNTVHWAAVEDALTTAPWLPARAEIEYREPILPGCEPLLVAACHAAGLDVWLSAGPSTLASAQLRKD
jgi:acyl-ACP thioesterase